MSESTPIQELLDRTYAAWAAGDADAYAACFTEDARYVAFDGDTFVGRQQIADAHRPLFTKWLAGSRLQQHSLVAREVAPGVIVANSSGAVLPKGKTKAPTWRISTQTWVAVQREGSWLLASFQNTRYRPFGKTLLGRLLALLRL
jgi:uncharacterized protein (TIGR02246 family)